MNTRFLPAILWAMCILLATNNYNFQALIFARDISFHLRLLPDFSDLFILHDIHLDSKTYVLQKLGHLLSFSVLFLLSDRALSSKRRAFILCSLFALFTECLQLFFARSGRLSDVLIDIDGVYLAYRLLTYVQKQFALGKDSKNTVLRHP